MTYNEQGKRTSLENLAGQVTTTAWDGWSVTYNGENRPVLWQCVSTNSPTHNSSTPTLISVSYDRMGRRVTKNNQRFVYDGYLQVADNNGNAYVWDPAYKVATRPLVWKSSCRYFYYIHDGNKNVSEVVEEGGKVPAHYEYDPFGFTIRQRGEFAAINTWRFSGEYSDDDTSMIYFNHRHYETLQGRWVSRDKHETYSRCLYSFVDNAPLARVDYIGLWRYPTDEEKKNGLILCNAKCEMTIYIPDNLDESSFPKDCLREHEQKHLDDLPKDSGCKKDEKGCCREAGMSPDSDDFGGKDKLKESECAAYLVTAKCCTRKAGLIGGNSSAGNTYDEMLSYRKCVLDAKYNAIGLLHHVVSKFGSPCDNEEEFNKLLKLFDEYFKRKAQGGER